MDEHEHDRYDKAFFIGVTLNIGFVVIEVVFGLSASSMALIADAGHNFVDVISLLVAWLASYLVRLTPSDKRTYGWRKASILGALTNSVILFIALGAMSLEGIRRLVSPVEVQSRTIIIVAAVGVVINTATALLFVGGLKQDLNIRGAFLHMAADAGVSLGVVAAGTGIMITGWLWLDAAVSLAIVVIICIGTWRLFRDSLYLAMDFVPAHIDMRQVRDYLKGLPGIEGVHDLHVWAMSTTETALTAHLVKPEHEGDDELISRIEEELEQEFQIGHITIQWERKRDGSS
jgi:cobalt-zinc-cadmium efflux system protein